MIFYMIVGGEPEPKRAAQPRIDEKLFLRIGADDREALEELYHLTERTLYSYVLSIVKNPHDAEDIVQETYLKIRACAHLYQPQGKPLAWMFTIAKNLSVSLFRRQSYFEPLNEETLAGGDCFADIENAADRMVLKTAFEILNERERQTVLLHLVSGLKHRQIASGLQVPLSTELSCYNRALKKLKKYLTGRGIAV